MKNDVIQMIAAISAVRRPSVRIARLATSNVASAPRSAGVKRAHRSLTANSLKHNRRAPIRQRRLLKSHVAIDGRNQPRVHFDWRPRARRWIRHPHARRCLPRPSHRRHLSRGLRDARLVARRDVALPEQREEHDDRRREHGERRERSRSIRFVAGWTIGHDYTRSVRSSVEIASSCTKFAGIGGASRFGRDSDNTSVRGRRVVSSMSS